MLASWRRVRQSSKAFRATLLVGAVVLVCVFALTLSHSGIGLVASSNPSATPTANPNSTRTLMPVVALAVSNAVANPDPSNSAEQLVAIQITWQPPSINRQNATLNLIASDPSSVTGLRLGPSSSALVNPVISLPLSGATPQSGWASFEVPNGIRDGVLEATFADGSLQKIPVKW